jgi:hypothetical protein
LPAVAGLPAFRWLNPPRLESGYAAFHRTIADPGVTIELAWA